MLIQPSIPFLISEPTGLPGDQEEEILRKPMGIVRAVQSSNPPPPPPPPPPRRWSWGGKEENWKNRGASGTLALGGCLRSSPWAACDSVQLLGSTATNHRAVISTPSSSASMSFVPRSCGGQIDVGVACEKATWTERMLAARTPFPLPARETPLYPISPGHRNPEHEQKRR
ncbi:hypothetical protein BP6252_01372 [Coleophoma cylindrospora]|uniref:Uncharacterized protein n=1 Tax=Coleophoma cylindrospora TaxID=1849047 RepID=A0A3D8SSQ2_9HELO|nr:hypothetical protein BP6252_01372 [Coleophoma cylindrospora]